MKVLVTGGAGFIGSHLVEALISKGFEVHILDNLLTGSTKNVHPSAVIHMEDIRYENAKNIIITEKPDIVFHLAAQADVGKSINEPNFDASVNINGTINILEASCKAGVKKVIFSSTSAVYGAIKSNVISEEHTTVPISFYGNSKLSAEFYIRLFYKLYGLPFTILRYGNVYGPRQLAKGEGGVVAIFLDRIKNRKCLTIYGDGEQTRDYIYVKDIVNANLAAIEHGNQETLNIGTSKKTSVNQLINYLETIHSSKFDTVRVESKKGDIKHSSLDNNKAIQTLEWRPMFDLYEGLKETYEFVMGGRINQM